MRPLLIPIFLLLTLLILPAQTDDDHKTLRVFIFAGQSNMEGQGVVSMDHEKHYNGGKGNLVWSMENSASKDLMKHLRNSKGEWAERDDVEISFKARGKLRKGLLGIGYTGLFDELAFGGMLRQRCLRA